MSRKKLLKDVEDGLLQYYLDHDYTIEDELIPKSDQVNEESKAKYNKMAKQILFKAKTQIKKRKVAKVISLAEATGRLKSLQDKNKGNVFSIFKRHVKQYGLAANYRNFDKMTEEEMENILNQLDLTALFNEIDENLDDE